ncbi:DUF4241 domain-containing protein [Saccharothrix luteola]|uniref:DUF4241 domain-containing protein n=1 Tax=Saccharothrix luteola TaxID=2893018 RepID=UPI001E45A1D6|nr:DUF4241 domain-containing protein [Saccharothrix luteola]MCC8250029.1 DUF4241 domain-containing protein [Saccharothrix luteola]
MNPPTHGDETGTRLSRRTVLLAGGLVALTAGGFLALSNVRRPPARPRPDLENLPVADVPAPTDEPVEVVYCAGWDSGARAPVSPMSESVARAQDAAGGQYAVVLLVGGTARAVVEVCWAEHHAELWHVDADGRRYRGVAYRRWPDGRLRLFEVRSWDYAGSGAPEFDGDQPTFRARVRRDATATIGTVGITAVQSDGSTLQTSRDWSDWPESAQPPENVTVPAVDGWPGFAGLTGPATARSGPAVVPTHFPWRPPRPLQPRHVTETVTDGARFHTQDGRVLTVRRIPVGAIRLPSGRVVVADPGGLDDGATPLATTAPPGEYPVDVFQVVEDGAAHTATTVACRVRITDAPVTSWHLALLDGDHELALGDGEFFGNPVDTATLSLVDQTGVTAYQEAEIEAAMSGDEPFTTLSAEGTDLVVVKGWSDGANPVWLGRNEDGALGCYVLDFLVPELATARPV